MAARKKKKLKSWQRRRRKRVKLFFSLLFTVLVIVIAVIFAKSLFPYESVDLSDYVTYTYSGYNTKGSVDATINEELTSTLMQKLIKDHEKALFNFTKCEQEDFNAFYNSLSVTVNAPEGLSNGSKYTYTVGYNKELAKKIKLNVKNSTKEVMVSGLVTATVISYDTLFEGISFTFDGVSPTITAEMSNNTVNPYLSDVEFIIEGEKEHYADGDVIRVKALFDEALCLEKHFVIDRDISECYKDFIVEGESHYVNSASELSSDIIDRAVSAANSAFTSKTANEYGVRVYFEAGIAPVYVNKKSTFEWVSYGPLSAYFKVANPDIAGKNSNNYNDLDIIYSGTLTQADGKSVNVEAVVRFKDIIINNDGTYTYDFSNPTISSCSHYDSRIKKNVITNYEKNWSVEKISLK